MKRFVLVGLLGVAVVLASSIAKAANGQTFTMMAENGSKQGGTVTLTPILDGTRVELKLDNEAPGAIEPAHIHAGYCPGVPPKATYYLRNVVFGESTTFLKGVTPDQIVGHGYAVNVHPFKGSKADVSVYVSCGDLK